MTTNDAGHNDALPANGDLISDRILDLGYRSVADLFHDAMKLASEHPEELQREDPADEASWFPPVLLQEPSGELQLYLDRRRLPFIADALSSAEDFRTTNRGNGFDSFDHVYSVAADWRHTRAHMRDLAVPLHGLIDEIWTELLIELATHWGHEILGRGWGRIRLRRPAMLLVESIHPETSADRIRAYVNVLLAEVNHAATEQHGHELDLLVEYVRKGARFADPHVGDLATELSAAATSDSERPEATP